MALAVSIAEPGGPDVLGVIDRDVGEPGNGEVRVAVSAAAVHPSDIAFRERGIEGVPPPWVPGWDGAGTVESVGPGVDGLAVGDAVTVVVSPRRPEGGAQSQLLVAPAASVVPVPAGVSLEQAATLPMNGLTALRGLELLGLSAGARCGLRHRAARTRDLPGDPGRGRTRLRQDLDGRGCRSWHHNPPRLGWRRARAHGVARRAESARGARCACAARGRDVPAGAGSGRASANGGRWPARPGSRGLRLNCASIISGYLI
jgi:hypothetical protein